jgi:CHAT domain-containing protein
VLTRERLGFPPGGLNDAVWLSQDIDHLRTALDSDDLLRHASDCEAEARRLRLPDIVADVLVERARLLRSAGRYGEAIGALYAAERKVKVLSGEFDPLRVRIYSGLAEAYAAERKWTLATDECERGIRLIEARRELVSGEYLQSSYLQSGIGLYRRGVEAAYQTRQYPLMLARAELAKCRSLLARYSNSGRPGIASWGETEEAFRAVCRRINIERINGQDEEALASLKARRRFLWDLLLIERARSGTKMPIPEFDLAAVQAILATDEAVLYYFWLDRRRLLVVFIDRRDFAHRIITISDEQAASLERWCARILAREDVDLLRMSEHLDKVDRFASFLLPAFIRKALSARHTRLLISPHHMLHALPFHALSWDSQHQFLIERFAVTYLPNLRSLMIPYERPRDNSLLALGIDAYRQRLDGEGHVVTDMPGAETELRDLGRLYAAEGWDVVSLSGSEASTDQIQELEENGRLASFARIHVAVHGQNVPSDVPMESYLDLFDARLEGLEVANWRLGAELVVLSACCSGQRPIAGRGLATLPGDDLFGLQAAFFAAGAKRVVCSLWPVEAPMIDMAGFHQELLAGLLPERALQNETISYLKAMRARERPLSNARYYWAPFFLSAFGRPVSEEHADGRTDKAQHADRIPGRGGRQAGRVRDRAET